jgi:signal transduction histidine kinase
LDTHATIMPLPRLKAFFFTPDTDDPRGVERTIGKLRVALAASGLIAMTVDPTQPALYAPIAYGILAGYVVLAVLLLLLSPSTHRWSRWVAVVSHVIDIAAGAALAIFTDGPNSPYFVFLMFPLLTAAYRWGMFETLLSATTALVALGLQVAVMKGHLPTPAGILAGEFSLSRLILRTAYLPISAVAVGYLAETEKKKRRESALVSELIREARIDAGLGGTLQSLLGAIARTFNADRALLVVQDTNTPPRTFLLDARIDRRHPQGVVTSSELDATTEGAYLFDAPGDGWYVIDRAPVDAVTVTALGEDGRAVNSTDFRLPAAFRARHAARSVLGVTVRVAAEWSGRLLLLNPEPRLNRDETIRFAQRLVRDLAPAVRQSSVLHRLRTRAERIERLRLARELHDGPIQSLSAVVLQLEMMKRRPSSPSDQTAELDALESLLRDEIRNMRDMTQDMRMGLVDTDAPHLVRDLSDIVEGFSRQSDIHAQFVSEVDFVNVSVAARRELMRVLHEALVNVRKHSQATETLVWLRVFADRLILSIEDDGRGFSFDGRLTMSELQARKQGPKVIQERVAALGGELHVESRPGRGARIEVRLPLPRSHSRSARSR